MGGQRIGAVLRSHQAANMLSWPMILMHRWATCVGIIGTIWPLQNASKYLYLKGNLEWCRLRDSNTRPHHYE